MPTLSPIIAAPDDEDEGFASGLTRDLRSTIDGSPSATVPYTESQQGAPPATPLAQPSPDATMATATDPGPQPITAPIYAPPDRSGLQQWENTLQKDQQPINRQDPAVKARWWERLAGGLGAGLMAAGGAPGAAQAGSAVVNRRYNQALDTQRQQVTADQTGVNAARADIAGSDQDFERSLQSFNAGGLADQRNATADMRRSQEQQRLQTIAPGTEQPDDPAKPLGTWHATTVGGQQISMGQPPDTFLKTPAGVLATREHMLMNAGIKPGSEDWKYGMVNGKLKEPAAQTNIHIPSAEAQQYQDWKTAFQRQNGRAPNADETANYKPGAAATAAKGARGTPNQFRELDAKTASLYAKAQQDYADEVSLATTPAQHEAAAAKLKAINDEIGTTHSQQLRDLGGIPAEDSRATPPTAAAPAAAAAPPAAAPAAATPPQPVQPSGSLPPQAAQRLKEGVITTFANQQQWTLRGGQQVRIK